MPRRKFNCRYYLPGRSGDEFVWRSRISYLQAIDRNHATRVVLRELECDVLPALRGVCRATGWNPLVPPPIKPFEQRKINAEETACVNDPPFLFDWWNVERAAEDFYPILIPLKQRLLAWVKRFNFTTRTNADSAATPVAWFVNCALQTLADWMDNKNSSNQLSWSYPGLALPNPANFALDTRAAIQVSVTYLRNQALTENVQFFETAFDGGLPAVVQPQTDVNDHGAGLFVFFGDPTPSKLFPFSAVHEMWNPCSATLSHFEASYRRFINTLSSRIETECRDHVSRMKEYLKQHDFVPVRDKINPQQYEHLAFYQTLGMSPCEIAERFKSRVSENAVFKGIQQVAREVGLSLRLARRGRRANAHRTSASVN